MVMAKTLFSVVTNKFWKKKMFLFYYSNDYKNNNICWCVQVGQKKKTFAVKGRLHGSKNGTDIVEK